MSQVGQSTRLVLETSGGLSSLKCATFGTETNAGLEANMQYEEFQNIKTEANRRAGEIAMTWLPSGHREGVQWVALNPTRDDRTPGSFSVNMRTGQWGDFATQQGGQSIVSLAKYLFGIPTSYGAAEKLKRMLGMP